MDVRGGPARVGGLQSTACAHDDAKGAGCSGLPEPNRPDRPNRRAVHGAGREVGPGGPEVRAGGSDDSPAWKASSAPSSRCTETVLHRPPARDFVSFMQQRKFFLTKCCILPKAVLTCLRPLPKGRCATPSGHILRARRRPGGRIGTSYSQGNTPCTKRHLP